MNGLLLLFVVFSTASALSISTDQYAKRDVFKPITLFHETRSHRTIKKRADVPSEGGQNDNPAGLAEKGNPNVSQPPNRSTSAQKGKSSGSESGEKSTTADNGKSDGSQGGDEPAPDEKEKPGAEKPAHPKARGKDKKQAKIDELEKKLAKSRKKVETEEAALAFVKGEPKPNGKSGTEDHKKAQAQDKPNKAEKPDGTPA